MFKELMNRYEDKKMETTIRTNVTANISFLYLAITISAKSDGSIETMK